MEKFSSIHDFEPKNIDIQFRFQGIKLNKDIKIDTCILKVKGNYPSGSQGAPVGEYLRGLGVFLREVFDLDALVIDLSLLNYTWGNNLLRVAEPEMLQTSDFVGNTWLGYYIIGSKKNLPALASLFCEYGTSSEIKKIYISIDDALRDIEKKAKKNHKD